MVKDGKGWEFTRIKRMERMGTDFFAGAIFGEKRGEFSGTAISGSGGNFTRRHRGRGESDGTVFSFDGEKGSEEFFENRLR